MKNLKPHYNVYKIREKISNSILLSGQVSNFQSFDVRMFKVTIPEI